MDALVVPADPNQPVRVGDYFESLRLDPRAVADWDTRQVSWTVTKWPEMSRGLGDDGYVWGLQSSTVDLMAKVWYSHRVQSGPQSVTNPQDRTEQRLPAWPTLGGEGLAPLRVSSHQNKPYSLLVSIGAVASCTTFPGLHTRI